MSIYDELDNIPKQVLSSELGDEFEGTIVSVTKATKKQGTGAGSPILQLKVVVKDGPEVTMNYRIPKALTGKGQYDLLVDSLSKLGLKLSPELVGKELRWKRISLGGSVQGFDRHYPVGSQASLKKK